MKSVFEKEERYWAAKLDAEDTMSFLPYSKSSITAADTDRKANTGLVHRMLPIEISERINALANGSDMAVYMILLAGVKGLLYTYTRQESILVGMPAFAESAEENDFLVIKNQVTRESTLKSLLGQIKLSISEAIEHQHIPFRRMIQEMNFQYSSTGAPIVNTLISYTKIHSDALNRGLEADTVFQFESEDRSIQLKVGFNTNRYDHDFMIKVTDHLFRLFSTILFQPEAEIGQVEVLSDAEKYELLTLFNDTQADYPREQTIHSLFEEQAERYPDGVAVVFEKDQLTYRELNERANRLARTLRAKGVQADQLVGIAAERSIEMVVGILAILKAGGAYVPIDPEYPEERIRYMLTDSGAQILLLQSHLREIIVFEGTIVPLDEEQSYMEDSSNLVSVNKPTDLAYVIYTSGTTGKPKGTLIEHKNVVRLLFNSRNLFDFGPSDIWTLFHSFCFDFSVWEMYGALLYGGKLVIVPQLTAKNPAQFLQLLKQHRVTILNQTPTYFYQLLREALADNGTELSLRKVIFGGEALSPQILKEWRVRYPDVQLINMYGITETTVHVTYKEITEVEIEQGKSNIGRPIPTLRVYVLDPNLKCVPVGVAGEMYVSGDGLARGYLHRPELTAERFVNDPFFPGERMYKSGDLARWQQDGSIEYLGRIDHQVKIRGYRIELGEVEAQLLKMESVQEAIVLAREDESGQKQLCAYFVADRLLTVSELRSALSEEMPAYMIPAYFVQLERMPLTSNGKTDRKALPAPDGDIHTGLEYVAPRTAQEAQLAQIWQEVLGLEQVGVKDNFFALGGHSLNLMQLVQRVYAETGTELPVHKVFQNPSVESMAYEIWESGSDGDSSHFVKLNSDGPVNVFCFPPGSGYGFSYLELAKALEGHSALYAIDFIDGIEDYGDMVERYADEVIRVQGQSPYVLLGYSVGGNLMFEVAKALEKRGCRVSDMIMVDSLIRQLVTDAMPDEELEDDIVEILDLVEGMKEGATRNPLIRDRIQQKVRAYLTYGDQLINTGTVEANIHGLYTEETEAVIREHHVPTWSEATRQAYREYRLIGVHAKVLHPEFIAENAQTIQQIVRQIAGQTGEVHKVLL